MLLATHASHALSLPSWPCKSPVKTTHADLLGSELQGIVCNLARHLIQILNIEELARARLLNKVILALPPPLISVALLQPYEFTSLSSALVTATEVLSFGRFIGWTIKPSLPLQLSGTSYSPFLEFFWTTLC